MESRNRPSGKPTGSFWAASTSPSIEHLESRLLLSVQYGLADAVPDSSASDAPVLDQIVALKDVVAAGPVADGPIAADSATSQQAAALASAEPAGGALSAQDVIDQWRARFPNDPYVCWQKESPWDGLDKLQSPPTGVQFVRAILLDMGRNEYESTSFVLTNLTDGPAAFNFAYDSSQIDITLRKGVWVYAWDGTEVNDALSLANFSSTCVWSCYYRINQLFLFKIISK